MKIFFWSLLIFGGKTGLCGLKDLFLVFTDFGGTQANRIHKLSKGSLPMNRKFGKPCSSYRQLSSTLQEEDKTCFFLYIPIALIY